MYPLKAKVKGYAFTGLSELKEEYGRDGTGSISETPLRKRRGRAQATVGTGGSERRERVRVGQPDSPPVRRATGKKKGVSGRAGPKR